MPSIEHAGWFVRHQCSTGSGEPISSEQRLRFVPIRRRTSIISGARLICGAHVFSHTLGTEKRAPKLDVRSEAWRASLNRRRLGRADPDMPFFIKGNTTIAIFCVVLLSCICGGQSAVLTREPNTSLRLPAEAPLGQYRYSAGIGEFNFQQPVALATPPGETNRVFVVERAGRVIVVTNLANPTTNVFLDITDRVASDYDAKKTEGLTSLAFHPNFRENGMFYVTYTTVTSTEAGLGNHNRLSQFRCSPTNLTVALGDSEVPFITQFDIGLGHNFNDAHFGPDGYLYVSLGDEGDGGQGDDFNNAQRIDKNFFSGIIRIDPDFRPGNPLPNPHPASAGNYAIPADNPFVGSANFNGKPVDLEQVRTEFYAIGLRNPWRFSFDVDTGALFAGDVGQHGREEINLIAKGGNYGWSFKEGLLDGPKGPPPTGMAFTDPLYEYGSGFGADQGFCVIGGLVYRGTRFPELYGAYIFGDYVSGNIWAMRRSSQSAVSVTLLLNMRDIVSFGTDPRNGDVLLVNMYGGRIWRSERSGSTNEAFPPTLADVGAFSDLTRLTPNSGIVPYEVNLPLWSDNAKKTRWFSVPDGTDAIRFDPEGNWTFPPGSVWIKHFELELTPGDAKSTRRIETRVLVKTVNGAFGLTYRWGDSATNAILVPEMGMDETFSLNDRGTVRTQIWHYPSRSECLSCHTPAGGYVLGFNTPQMNRDFRYTRGATNQILALSAAGYFVQPVSNVRGLRALADPSDESISREYRVRSLLFANCVQCHQPGGVANATWDARLTTPIDRARLVNAIPLNSLSDPDARIVKPGSPEHSVLLKRIGTRGANQMPPLGTSVIDPQAVELLNAWTTWDLPAYESFAEWQTRFLESSTKINAEADPDGDGSSNYSEFINLTNPNASSDFWKVSVQKRDGSTVLSFVQPANRGCILEAKDSLDGDWNPSNSPDNLLVFPKFSTNRNILDPVSTKTRYYRVRMISP